MFLRMSKIKQIKKKNNLKPIRRRRNVPKGKKRNGQMKILVGDESQISPARIYGESHFPGKKIPGFKVLVTEDPKKAYRKIGARKAIIYHAAA